MYCILARQHDALHAMAYTRIVYYGAYTAWCIHTWMREGRQEMATYCILKRVYDVLYTMAYIRIVYYGACTACCIHTWMREGRRLCY
jgi:hypothetical protein